MAKWTTPLIRIIFLGAVTLGPVGSSSFRACAGTLLFSKPQLLTTLPWAEASNQGVSPKGPEWLVVDRQGRIILESELDFNIYSPRGKYLQTLQPIDKTKNFYGFSTLETLADGSLLFLARLETPQEQWGKDNFQEHSKPGARVLVLSPDGRVKVDKEVTDPDQPHSNYYSENGVLYSVRDDGSFRILEPAYPKGRADEDFGSFAAIAYSLDRWRGHLKNLPVFRSGNKIYHDTKGQVHEIKGAVSTLMGQNLVEGIGPLAARDGKIFYQVVCDKNQDFINAVFVEDVKRKNYGLVDLLHSDEELDMPHGHAVFIDPKGNIYEGVGKKDGYRVYEWKLLN